MEYPTMVYRGFGPHSRKGGGFSTLGVNDDVALDAAIADGWYLTLPEAIEAHDKPVAKTVTEEAPDAEESAQIPDDAPPTRKEIEAKCLELGISVHHRHTDATLLAKIDEAMKV